MKSILLSLTKKNFCTLVQGNINQFKQKMEDGASECFVSNVGEQEVKSWEENAKALSKLLSASKLPDDVIIGFEYLVPVGGRIDCVLFGHGLDGKKNMVHIELKQWSNENVSTYYSGFTFNVVVDGYRSGSKICSHPSAQAEEYQNHLLNYISAFDNDNIGLYGFAYCYNYNANNGENILVGEEYSNPITVCPLFCKGQEKKFADELYGLLGNGGGQVVMDEVLNCDIRPTKRLQDAAKNMFDGKCTSEEFALIGNQLDAYNSILGAIKETDKDNEKTVVIVKGGPGTGKSVIAMRLVAGLAKTGRFPNVYYSTRSTSLIKGYKEILKKTNYSDGNSLAAIDLFLKNARVKPNQKQRENWYDAILVDEAHRIEQKANDMNDRDKSLQTHLSQIMAMLFVSRVSVFFIDDFQSIDNKEIGTAANIKAAAQEYYSRILRENKEYEEGDYSKLPDKIEGAYKNLQEKLITGTAKQINDAEKRYRSLCGNREWGKTWLEVAQPTDLKINVIEIELEDQFRCNGSNNYLDWLESVLYKLPGKENVHIDSEHYQFEVMDTPQEVYDKVRKLDDYAVYADKRKEELQDAFNYKSLQSETKNMDFAQHARLIAGWCWEWKDGTSQLQDNGDLAKEVSIPEYNFELPWETNSNTTPKNDFNKKYAKNAELWCISNEGVNQTGCIFSMQGWETDYVGVIIGPDLKYDKKTDSLISCAGAMNYGISKGSVLKGNEEETRLIRNIYRVLLTRGKKGCFVFACNPGVRDYLRRCMNR